MLLFPFEQKRVGCSTSPAFRTAKNKSLRCINLLLLDGDTTISTRINELFWRDILRLDSETQSTKDRSTVLKVLLELHSPLKMDGWKTTIFLLGIPYFQGKKLTGFVSGRGSPSDAARMAWLVVLVPSRCTEPLRRGARRPTDDPPGERSHFPTNFPDGEVGKIIMYGYPGGYAALNFCCWLYLPVTYLMMWRFVGLVEIFYWLVRDLTIETNPCESHQQEPFPDGHSNSNGWWYRLHRPRTYIWKIWALYRHVYIFTPCRTMHLYMHIHLSNIL